jgi:THO complex subunit 2
VLAALTCYSSNSEPTRKATAKEVEDGEVDDAKASAAKEKSAAETSNIGKSAANDIKPTSSKFSTPSGPSDDIGPNQVPLGKREPPRDDATKPSSSNFPPRGDFNRNPIPDRPPAGLPSRPDAPIPRGLPSDRHLPGRLPERREMHPSRMEGPGRNWQDRRNPDMPPPRDFGRPERGPPFDRSRDRHDPMRRGGELFAENRERDNSAIEHRQPELNGRPSRDDLVPSRPIVPPPDRGPTINPERLPIINQDQKETINPARAALISGSADLPRAESPRGLRDDSRQERPGSRAHSPRRGDRHGGGDREPFDGRRGDRPPGARGPPEDIRLNRRDDNQSGPFPPRFDRNIDRSGPDKGRDVFQLAPPPHRPMDPDHGRLNQAPRQPDPNFGRLNAASPQAPDIPSGPRNTRGGMRQSSGNAPRGDHRSIQGTLRQQSPDRQPPTGPANDRTLRRPESVPSLSTGTVSITTNTGVPSPTAVIHPERLRQLSPDVQAQVNTPIRNSQSDDAAAAGIHPDRLRAFQNDQPPPRAPPLQTSNFRQEAAASPPISGPPSGPKSQGAQTPTSSTPNSLNAPTGPSSANERVRGPMRQLAGINSILQPQNDRSQGRDWGMNVRGRGNVATSFGVPKRPDSRPTTPVHNRPESRENARGARDSAPAEQTQQAPDLFSNRVTKTEDERPGGRAGRDGGSSRRDARSGRHSRRPSRSRSPAPERERGERSHRERDHAGTSQDVRTDAGGNSSRNEFRESRGGRHRDPAERDRRTSGKNPVTDGGGGDGRERGGRRDGARDDKRSAEGMNEWSRNVPPPPPGPPPVRDGGDRRSGRDDRQDRRGGGRDDGGGGSKRRGDDGRADGRGRDNKRPRQG